MRTSSRENPEKNLYYKVLRPNTLWYLRNNHNNLNILPPRRPL